MIVESESPQLARQILWQFGNRISVGRAVLRAEIARTAPPTALPWALSRRSSKTR
jgi:hypothetical protein